MSADSVADTVYSDSQMVVITIASFPASAPWLAQTTYLLDQSGHTTAVLAQTDQPTGGVTLAPVPYTTQAPTPLASTTASNLPLGWAYEGCYNDQFSHGRVLSLEQPYDSNLTVESCVWSCYQRGYSISGLEDRRQCFCGNAILDGGTLADWDFDCNMSCSGNQMQICGGNNLLSIYANRTLTTSRSAVAQSSELTKVTPTIAPTLTSAHPRTSAPSATIIAAVIGAIAGVVIMVGVIFCLHRRMKRNLVKTNGQVQGNTSACPPVGRVSSWEEFDIEGDKNTMLSIEGKGSGLGLESTEYGYYPGLAELKVRDRAQLSQPTSILKHPRRSGTTNIGPHIFEDEDEHDPKDVAATGNLALAKKCVRFGVNQIREFSRSPFIGHGSSASEC